MRGGAYYPTIFVSPESLLKMGIRFKPCKHCGGQAEIRCVQQKATSVWNPSPVLCWAVCLDCGIQTSRYAVLDKTRTFRMLQNLWNRSAAEGRFISQIERGSHYGDGEGN